MSVAATETELKEKPSIVHAVFWTEYSCASWKRATENTKAACN